jgi:hypothetical protein
MEKYVSNGIMCCILCDCNAKMVERLDVFCYISILLKTVEGRII